MLLESSCTLNLTVQVSVDPPPDGVGVKREGAGVSLVKDGYWLVRPQSKPVQFRRYQPQRVAFFPALPYDLHDLRGCYGSGRSGIIALAKEIHVSVCPGSVAP